MTDHPQHPTDDEWQETLPLTGFMTPAEFERLRRWLREEDKAPDRIPHFPHGGL